MADPTTPTADDRIARLEARVAELERRLAPPAPGLYRTPAGGTRITLPPEVLEAQMAEYQRRAAGPLMPLEELYRMQLEAGADPDGTWAREEIERMREE
ncbi:MAG: hypothetical protein K2X82_02465 [Gemmataceae bacterium]|nr:hypothetical protein [Gemmataceae bacterium]